MAMAGYQVQTGGPSGVWEDRGEAFESKEVADSAAYEYLQAGMPVRVVGAEVAEAMREKASDLRKEAIRIKLRALRNGGCAYFPEKGVPTPTHLVRKTNRDLYQFGEVGGDWLNSGDCKRIAEVVANRFPE